MVATMEALSSTPVPRSFDTNGSSVRISGESDLAESSFEVERRAGAPAEIPSRGLSGATLAGIATVVGLAALALGAWAVVRAERSGDGEAGPSATAVQGVQQVVSLLSRPSTERIPLQGSSGRIVLVVGARGYGVLVVDGLSPAPSGKSYQAWVIRPSADAPQSGAVFSGSDVVVPLTTAVPPGAAVAITLERAGGAPAPTQTPKLIATRTT